GAGARRRHRRRGAGGARPDGGPAAGRAGDRRPGPDDAAGPLPVPLEARRTGQRLAAAARVAPRGRLPCFAAVDLRPVCITRFGEARGPAELLADNARRSDTLTPAVCAMS